MFLIFVITSSIFDSNIYSCAGYIVILSIFSVERWLTTLKYLIESISSPQNSSLTPSFSLTEISTIPPLTLNCPLPSIKSHLTYPNSTSFCFIVSRFSESPTLKFSVFLYNAFLLYHFLKNCFYCCYYYSCSHFLHFI